MKKTLLAMTLALTMGSSFAADLPNITILATGGTIAGTASSSTQTTEYKPGQLAIETLISAVPEMTAVADVTGEQVANIGSESMTDEVWLKLAKRCNELLAKPDVDGIVITHGTDTLEETAYFLTLTVKSKKPVVIVGAMRPATAISADGPLNLLNAVKVAASAESHNKGVLVAMNDEINAGRDVTKTYTTNVDTFHSPVFGSLGVIVDGKPLFYRLPVKPHTTSTEFDVSNLTKLPRVDIVYSHANDDGVMTDAAVKAGAKGIIHAGTGNGSIHGNTEQALKHAVDQGVVVVRSSRTGSGYVTPNTGYRALGLLEADTLNPQKARVLLQLILTKSKDPAKVQAMLDTY